MTVPQVPRQSAFTSVTGLSNREFSKHIADKAEERLKILTEALFDRTPLSPDFTPPPGVTVEHLHIIDPTFTPPEGTPSLRAFTPSTERGNSFPLRARNLSNLPTGVPVNLED